MKKAVAVLASTFLVTLIRTAADDHCTLAADCQDSRGNITGLIWEPCASAAETIEESTGVYI